MTPRDTIFAGSIPGLYDRYLGPLLFEPYANEVARRAAVPHAGRVLEVAAGTRIVTRAIAEALPDAEILATDLNPAMLDVARMRVQLERVRFQPADALELPFERESFVFVLCQFGAMFYNDFVRLGRIR